MKKHLLIAGLACLMTGSLQAQFQHSYGLTTNEGTPSVQYTVTDNGYIAAGKTDLATFGGGDATLIKTDITGNQLWSRVYGGSAADQFSSVKENPGMAVRYAAAGSTFSYSGTQDGYLVGTDQNGLPLFTRVFGGARTDRFNHIQKIVHPFDGPGYIMVGETNSFNYFGPEFDIYVVRTDLNGNLKAAVVLGNKGDQYANWLEPTGDGYIIAGSTTYNCTAAPAGVVQRDIYAVKLDHNFNIVWDRVFGNNNVLRNDVAYGVKVDNFGNYVFTGETQSYGLPGGDAFLMKTTPAGGLMFFRTYGGGRNDQGRSLVFQKTAAGTFYYVTGYTSSFNSLATPDAYLFKTDVNGNHLWSRVYGKDRPDYSYEINFSSSLNNGFILAGNEFSFGVGNSDVYLIKTDINGLSSNPCQKTVTPTVQSFLPCLFSGAQAVRVDNYAIVQWPSKLLYYTVNKCDVPVISPARTDEVDELNISSGILVSPNPASSFVNISGVADLKGATVSVKDLNGRSVKEIMMDADQQQIAIDDLEKGIYMVIITQSDGTVVKEKLVVQ